MFDRKAFGKRILTALFLNGFLLNRYGNTAMTKIAQMKGIDKEDFYVSMVRGFKPG